MHKSQQAFQRLKQHRLIALLTARSAAECVTAFETLDPLGIVLEVAFRSAAALDGLRAVLEKHPDALVLAGTVMTPRQAEQAIELGVAGVVSADYVPAVVQTCVERDVMVVPGGLGDVGKQLAQKAELYGCEFDQLKTMYPYQWVYKLFPAVAGNTLYVELAKAWKGPFSGLTVVYTGGVSFQNLPKIAALDPEGIFCGSALTKDIATPLLMQEEAKRWQAIVRETCKV
ncbi:MAG: bifunctional 4-hydroxy-2-oxoglutarate aldolase/2-dehydro-3-deoxy-phosphogluconate aldolase [bacterium]|jgi:2-keto-3-deoxy-6-phosphogluconate aldolase|nr:bifunctional 4-hydroxy-2-oxoglutarate aldolase/2-dehydro-3-deoxy-phosphogluconate aldolase [candidate division KSB1 bacterium]MDH7559242.1 bifunctional 4-hydroxy-2-oxoglutarate aldolase/2-dehydro-3-deoxy-phosphogluconate aldolase [bacterium]